MNRPTPPSDVPPICDYEGSTYRTDFWENQGREYEDGAERLALRHLLPPRGRRLLDIGAGFGRLAGLYNGYDQVILLDYSRSQLEYARQRYGDERFLYVAADIYRLPLATNAVDTTVMVRVLHHLVDVPLALQHIQRITRPQGTFVMEFANKRHLKNVLRYALGRGANPFDRQPLEYQELHYDFHPAWVAERLAEAGFRVEQRRSVSIFRAGPLKRIFSPRFLVTIDGILQGITAPFTPAPSVFYRTTALKPGVEAITPTERLFCCPTCGHEPLERKADHLACPTCGAHWPIINGVYVFK